MVKEDLKGYQWALRVVNGKEIANKYVKLECKRYIDRLNNGLDEELIEFDFKEVEIIYKLLKCLNFATGFFAGKSIYEHIHGFQFMIWENIFCWFLKENDELGFRKRLIEEVYLEIGRKASKSFIAAVTEILIMLRADRFTQTACAGLTRDISALVRNSTVEIIQSSPLVNKHFKITRDKVECLLNNSTMKHLSGQANNINGLLLSSYIVDEVANQEDSSIIDALKLSQMNTKTRLGIYISTQYGNPLNAFNDLIDYHKGLLDGVDDLTINTFGLLFELDKDDNFKDENNWYKCNPLQMGMANGRDFLRKEFKKGLTIPSAMSEFRIKILNERLNMTKGDPYIPFDIWKKCRVEKVDLKGKEVIVGVDASLTTDLTAVSIMYKEGKKYYFTSHAFVPRGTLADRKEKTNYYSMEEQGHCTILEGSTVDYNKMEEYMLAIEEKFECKVKMFVCDPYNIVATMQRVESEGNYKVKMLKQNYTNLTPALKNMRDEIYLGNFFYEKNALLDICVYGCVTTKPDKFENFLLDKSDRNKSRIDMLVAGSFCYTELFNKKKTQADIYAEEAAKKLKLKEGKNE